VKKMEKLKLHERFRLFIQCISFCFHNGYVRGWLHGKISSGDNKGICVPGLNCYSCPGAVGACPLGSLQAVLDSGKYHISLYVFGFIAGIGVFCGRFVCGWLCPFGLIQDLLHRIPLFKKVKNMPGHKYLRYLRFVILALFVIILPATVMNAAGSGEPWFCEWICPSGTLLGGIPLLIMNPALRPAAGIRFGWKCLILLAVIILSMKYYRPFCKYVCPLGAMYGVCNPISIYRLKCDESTCVKCGACQRACGMDIKVWETPNSMDCIRCGKCLKSCPTGALTTTFTKKKTEEDKSKVNSVEVAEASDKTENVSVIKPSNLYIVWGYMLIALGVVAAIVSLVSTLYYANNADVPGDLSSVMFLYIQMLAWIVPAVMLIIFGNNLTNLSEKPENIDKLKEWPLKLLLVWGITFAIVYFSNIFTFMLDGGVELRDFWNNIDYIFSNAKAGVIITLTATLLTVIFIRRKAK